MSQDTGDKAMGGQSSGAARQQSRLEYALRKEGASEQFIARRLMYMAEAKGKRWNKATKSYETFEDYKVQLAAQKQFALVFGHYPTQKELEDRHKPHEVVLQVVQETSPPKRK